MATNNEWAELNPLRPFFKEYIHAFAEHFLRNYKDIYHLDPSADMKLAVGHVYIRHFLPGLPSRSPPAMSPAVQAAYQQLMKEQKVFSLTIIDMMKDLMVHQVERNANQMAVFQHFMSTSLPSEASPGAELLEQASQESHLTLSLTPIMDMLAKVKSQEEGIKAMNIFQDVPIVHAVQVLELFPQEKQARFLFNRYHATAIALDGHTFLKSALLPGTVKGSVISMDQDNSTGVLGRFQLANFRQDHRGTIRVRPALPIKLEVLQGDESFHGKLLDISTSGMGVELSQGELEVNSNVQIHCYLPPDHELLLNGLITGSHHRGRGSFLGIRLFLGYLEEGLVNQYIQHRREEVVQSLKKITYTNHKP